VYAPLSGSGIGLPNRGEGENRGSCCNPEADPGGEALAISMEDFRDGLEVEPEHDLAFSDANITIPSLRERLS
jgi:hypothetical protein